MKNLLAFIVPITAFCNPNKSTAQSIDFCSSSTRAVVNGISNYQEAQILYQTFQFWKQRSMPLLQHISKSRSSGDNPPPYFRIN